MKGARPATETAQLTHCISGPSRRSHVKVLVLGWILTANVSYAQTGAFEPLPVWFSGRADPTTSVALGDVDSDGDHDLVCGNYLYSTTLYLNTGERFEAAPAWFSGRADRTFSVALGDVDGDGDLDLVCGNGWRTGDSDQAKASTTLYLNTGPPFHQSA